YQSDYWRTEIAPRIPTLIDREQIKVTRIVATPRSVIQEDPASPRGRRADADGLHHRLHARELLLVPGDQETPVGGGGEVGLPRLDGRGECLNGAEGPSAVSGVAEEDAPSHRRRVLPHHHRPAIAIDGHPHVVGNRSG